MPFRKQKFYFSEFSKEARGHIHQNLWNFRRLYIAVRSIIRANQIIHYFEAYHFLYMKQYDA